MPFLVFISRINLLLFYNIAGLFFIFYIHFCYILLMRYDYLPAYFKEVYGKKAHRFSYRSNLSIVK